MKTTSGILIYFLFTSVSFAGGIVGNGAGLVEQNIQFAYLNLPKIISGCHMANNQCGLTQEESSILKSIEQIVLQNYTSEDRIQFVSEKLNPGFFTTSSTENYRIAKTGLDTKLPIFFNVDELYDLSGRPSLDFSTVVALLIHEVGHQTGEPNHAKLDILGAKIRFSLSNKLATFDFEFASSQNRIQFNILTYPMPTPIAEVYFTAKSGKSLQLTSRIMKKINCSKENEVLVGFNLNNEHWNRISGQENLIDFESWVQVYCSNMKINSITTRSQNLLIHLSEQGEVLGLDLN